MKQGTIELGGSSYLCTALPAREGTRVAARLAAALAPGLNALPEEGFEVDPAMVAKILGPIFSDPGLADTLDFLITKFSARTVVTDLSTEKQLPLDRVFDTQFSDNYDLMIEWLLFSVNLSLSSFFRSARALAVRAVAAGKSPSKSPTSAEKTGSAGE